MNKHPLTADFHMYYAGTYVFRNGPNGPEAMLVDGTNANGDDTQYAGVNLSGHTYSETAELGYVTWTGDEMVNFRPISGYFALKGKERSSFVTFAVGNRTQRKGFNARDVIVGGGPWTPNGSQVVKLFVQSQGLDSRPAFRDLYIDKNRAVHWKGVKVGSQDAEGKFTADEAFKQFEEMVCRLLQSF